MVKLKLGNKEYELTDQEHELIKEALNNNSVRYAYDSSSLAKEEPEWSKKLLEKSDAMTELLNKIS